MFSSNVPDPIQITTWCAATRKVAFLLSNVAEIHTRQEISNELSHVLKKKKRKERERE
jgi:hypothetical protein